MPLTKIREKIENGVRLTKADAMRLFKSDDLFTIGEMACTVARKNNGKNVYYVRNLHINPTNICVNRCKFCAFSRSAGDADAYELSINEILKKISDSMPIEEVHIVGGLHPDWPFEHYLKMVSAIRKKFPKIHIKAFTATEIEYMSRISQQSIEQVLKALKQCGLDAMPGGGAEIFDSDVREQLCPEKLSSDGWLQVMELAHAQGIKSNATMLYGHLEKYEHRVDHLIMLRKQQDISGGFQAFIPLSYHPGNTEIGGEDVSALDDLKTIAISRLMLDNFPHVKAYWVMLGEKISQLALNFGADDLDGTVLEEKVTYATSTEGERTRRGITEGELVGFIKKAGLCPVRRDALYRKVRA
jgi:aminodeoxyfutalosine synthase